MKLRYRLVKKGDEYYPQMSKKYLFIWGGWYRISRWLNNDFELYESLSYPSSKSNCEQVIKDFDKWYKNQIEKSNDVEYIPINLESK